MKCLMQIEADYFDGTHACAERIIAKYPAYILAETKDKCWTGNLTVHTYYGDILVQPPMYIARIIGELFIIPENLFDSVCPYLVKEK